MMLGVAFAAIMVFFLQYIFRSLDMGTLTSWRWVFGQAAPAGLIPVLLSAVLLALLSAGIDLPEKYPALFLFALSFGSCLPFLDGPEVMIDAARYFLQAKYLSIYGIKDFLREWGHEVTAWTDLPLVPFMYGVLFTLTGEGKAGIVIGNALLYSLIPVLTFLAGSRLWDRSTGFLAGLLTMASPYLFTQVPWLLVDMHTTLFLLLAIVAFLYQLEHGGLCWSLISGLSIVLALLCKFSTWPMLPGALGIIFLSNLADRPQATINRSAAVAAVVILLLGILYYWKGAVIIQQIRFLRTYQLAGLQRWREGYLSALVFQTHPFLVLAALAGVCRAFINRDRKMLFMGWFVILVFFLDLQRVRYLLPLLPYLALAGGYGLHGLKSRRVRRFIVYCGVLSSFVVAVWVYKPFLARTSMVNLRDAGEFLDTLSAEAVEVFCLPQENSVGNTSMAVPILDLYTDKMLYQPQPWTNDGGLERAKNTSLRFSWEINQPVFYRNERYKSMELPLVIIAGGPVTRMPSILEKDYPSARLLRQFTKTTSVFRYQTFVSIFDRH
jgi:hypothetical protein